MTMTDKEVEEVVYRNSVVVSSITNSILFTNDIAISYVIDAVSQLRKSGYFARLVKMLTQKVDREVALYEKSLNAIMKESSYKLADANDKFLDFVDYDLKKLYYCIKFEYDKQKVPDSKLLSLVRMTGELCNLADTQTEVRIEELASVDKRFRTKDFSVISVKRIRKAMNNLMEALPSAIIENSPEVNMAFDIFMRKVADKELLTKAIGLK